jgi:hypothetical protein
MQRNEKLTLIRDLPAAIIATLDGVLATQGLRRVATRELEEDFTPLLTEPGGPLVFVFSQPHDDWTACFSSLEADDEWQLAETLAIELEQPTAYVVISEDIEQYAYRYFADGVLHEEFLPDDSADERLDLATLLDKLSAHGISLDLIDDRSVGFGAEHIMVGYSLEHSAAPDDNAAPAAEA